MAKREYGNNIQAEILTSGKLLVEIDLTKEYGRSKSGKTITIATTRGNIKLQDDKGKEIVLGINCYKYPED